MSHHTGDSSSDPNRNVVRAAHGANPAYVNAANTDTVARTDYAQNGPSSHAFPGQAPPFSLGPDAAYLWNNSLGEEELDTQYPDFFGPPNGEDLMGTTGTSELSRAAGSMPRGPAHLQYRPMPAHTHTGDSIQPDSRMHMPGSSAPPTRFPAQPGPREHRQEFACIQCGATYDRRARARDCQYQDRGETPYQCRGACGDIWCFVAYSSEECLRRHISPNVQCPLWYPGKMLPDTRKPTVQTVLSEREFDNQ